MNVLIVTGLSGAGKTRALRFLEDIGYYCMDNISPRMLLQVVRGELQEQNGVKHLAVAMDIRSTGVPEEFDGIVAELNECQVDVRVLFLDCSEEVLLKRYKESRRLHPLMKESGCDSLLEAIREEVEKMKVLKPEADYLVDTSNLSSSQLMQKLQVLFADSDKHAMHIEFVAFGYKFGILGDADLIFDVRCVENPYYVKGLKEKTGEDKEVRDYVMSRPESRELFSRMVSYLEYAIPLYEKEGKGQLVVGLGCTGGQHRSVTFAKLLQEYFAEKYPNVHLGMRDMQQNQSIILADLA